MDTVVAAMNTVVKQDMEAASDATRATAAASVEKNMEDGHRKVVTADLV